MLGVNIEDLVIYAIDYGMKLRVKYVEARYHRIDEFSIKSRNGSLVFSSANKLDRESIRVVVENAYRDAKNRLKLMRRAKNIC